MDFDQIQNELSDFIRQYESATNSHNFDEIEPLVSTNASYLFNDGTFKGLQDIRKAFENTWHKVQSEVYRVEDLRWVIISDEVAVCTYEFYWTGLIDGEEKSGRGRGTNVINKQDGQWRVVHEHLSK